MTGAGKKLERKKLSPWKLEMRGTEERMKEEG